MEYKIKWEIDIEADSPEEAAAKAMYLQQNDDSQASIYEVTDTDGNVKEIDVLVVIEAEEQIAHIKRVVGVYGEFSVYDVEADSSPVVNSLGDVIQLAESFNADSVTCTTYIGSREESSQDISYEELASIDPTIIEQIWTLADQWIVVSVEEAK